MIESELPAYAFLVTALVVIANLGTAWVVLLTMGENNGSLTSGGPPLLAALSCLLLLFMHYNIIVPREVSFWGSAFLAALGFWGAWVDYAHLTDRRKNLDKTRNKRR